MTLQEFKEKTKELETLEKNFRFKIFSKRFILWSRIYNCKILYQ